ncbi:serine/threonine protein phosphatase [Salmonella enterica subsp. enterica]|nr:serine/threonine protein phosphatase [Salmonella enterica subsp. enterica]EEJ8589973.1 serine/threonine protein phosphatase [Salmonella enterica subsp. enterica]
MSVYQHINGAEWRNIQVVGDLHGCHSLLMEKLDEAGFDTSRDLLISVGDLTDRGEENVECLALLNQPWFRAVRGNHEQVMLDCLLHNGNEAHWIMNGGGWFFELERDQERQVRSLLLKVAALPLIIEVSTPDKKYVICHADYPGNHYAYGKPVNEDDVVWSRERITASDHGRVESISGADQFIFGHTPLHLPLQFANQHYIDTGAVFTGNLTLLQIQGGDTHL